VPEDNGPPTAVPPRTGEPHRGSLLFRAPPAPVTLGLIVLVSAALAALYWPRIGRPLGLGVVVAFAGPALVACVVTTPLARVLGGRLEFHRSVFLVFSVLLLQLPLAAAWRGAEAVWPKVAPPLVLLAPFLAGPAFWFRHLTLYGVSRSSHARMLPVSLLHPLLALLGLAAVLPFTATALEATIAILPIAFVCAVAVLTAADRPIEREFHASGVSLIRPLLNHVENRDEEATRTLEAFFLRSAVLATVRVSLLGFVRDGKVRATMALPAVHPGPFAALGASDLPQKLSTLLGPDAGTVLVPHTPCDHDLDLPSRKEVERLASASRELLGRLAPARSGKASPLVSPRPGSLARAQVLGDVALVVVSQAPRPTDDIAYAVADRIVREIAREEGSEVALIDAHNSYVEGQGDISFGSPVAQQLEADARAAVVAARAASRDGPVEVGVASRAGYSIGRDGIGPQGIRALVIRAGGSTTGYVLVDGNNLVVGARDRILPELLNVVDAAELLTTDNHVVHEVDGGINPLGERYPAELLARDAREVLEQAFADLGPAEPRYATTELADVRVLGPGYTARLLTSLGDTLSMFARIFPASLALLLTSSLVVALLLR
jgi:putative membrane protein